MQQLVLLPANLLHMRGAVPCQLTKNKLVPMLCKAIDTHEALCSAADMDKLLYVPANTQMCSLTNSSGFPAGWAPADHCKTRKAMQQQQPFTSAT
jgi:hypothetical protein